MDASYFRPSQYDSLLLPHTPVPSEHPGAGSIRLASDMSINIRNDFHVRTDYRLGEETGIGRRKTFMIYTNYTFNASHSNQHIAQFSQKLLF